MDGIASSSSTPRRHAEPVVDTNFRDTMPFSADQDHHTSRDQAISILRREVRGEASIPGNSFAFTPPQLHRLLTERSLAALSVFGGLDGLALGLRTHLTHGLSVDETTLDGTITFDEALAAARDGRPPRVEPVADPLPTTRSFAHRRRIFGANTLPRRRQKSFLKLMWIAFNDKLIILLAISACISLVIGIYQSVFDKEASRIEWVDGVTVVAAIAVIVLASAATDWQKNYRFRKLTERNQQRNVTVLRSGRVQQVSLTDIMVGDIAHIEAGEVLVADGVLVESSSLYIDESSLTGESELLLKTAPTKGLLQEGGQDGHDGRDRPDENVDPFIMSGTTVRRGVGRYLITSIGANSIDGKNLMSLGEGVDITPLQERLGRLGKQLIIFGAAAGTIYFIVLFVRFLVRLPHIHHKGPTFKAEAFLHIVMLATAIVVITIPEGLALNVTIALAFATKKMLKDNNLVRLIRSVEVMGSATCICSDKTGTLTQNRMTVVAGRVGLSRDSGFDDGQVSLTGSSDPSVISSSSEPKHPTSRVFMSSISPQVKALIKDSVALNSTAFERDNSADAEFLGSSTETALLSFSREHLGMGALGQERANSQIVAMLPFDPSRKWMAVLVKLVDADGSQARYRLLVKGAAEIVFEYCAYVVADPTYRLTTAHLEEDDRASFSATIQNYADNLLRPVAIAFRDFDEHEVLESPSDEDSSIVNLEWLASGMVFIGFFGLHDPLRPQVVESVRKCQEAGVFVRMVTGDNFLTAKAVALECGIYTPGGVAMDGATFRRLTQEQREAIVPRLQVLARSSPEDKVLLVTCLREMGETVAVTGDGTNDAFALKAADVGFAMGIQGTEVAKEAASIILLDDNFASIVKALGWGRTVIDAVRKFCQFQFTINITAGILAAVSELVGDSIFTVVQLLWINLIMDIFASLAFATDRPSPEFLKRKPEPRNAPLVTITMWKMIIGQAIYQCLVVFLVHYIGWDILRPDSRAEIEKLQSMVFNIYVWMQFFNQHNCRRVDNKVDIYYQGILTNLWFLGVQAVTVVGQFVIMFKGGEAFDTKPLSGTQWGWSLLFGIVTIPLGALIRQIPDRYVLRLFHALQKPYLHVTGPLRRRLRLWRNRNHRHDRQTGDAEDPDPDPASPDPDGLAIQLDRSFLHLHSHSNSMKLHSMHSSLGLSAHSTQVSLGKRAATSSFAETIALPDPELDLPKMIDAAKHLQLDAIGHLPENEMLMLEIHPRTAKDDPILTQRSDLAVPPSQDAAVLAYLVEGKTTRRVKAPTRRRSIQIQGRRDTRREERLGVEQEPVRPGKVRIRERYQGWLTWEGLLRSKRR